MAQVASTWNGAKALLTMAIVTAAFLAAVTPSGIDAADVGAGDADVLAAGGERGVVEDGAHEIRPPGRGARTARG